MLAVKRHRALETLAKDIRSDGVNIDDNDIEKLVDLYERIVKTTTSGCDNTKVLDAYIDPYASIDFGGMEEDGIESLRQFVKSIDELSENEKFADNISPLERSTMNAILEGNNIVIVLKHVQESCISSAPLLSSSSRTLRNVPMVYSGSPLILHVGI